MPTPELAAQLAEIGGFALFLFVVVFAAVGLWKQWWVPGWIWRAEVEARKASETQALRNAESLEKLARGVSREQRRNAPPAPRA